MNAFPNPHLTHQTGMDLRDYFAAKAMAGLIDAALIGDEANEVSKEDVCLYCYEWADAMMEARNAAQ